MRGTAGPRHGPRALGREGLAWVSLAAALAVGRAVVVEFRVSDAALGWSRRTWRWDTGAATALDHCRSLEASVGGAGVTLHLDLSAAYVVPQPEGYITMDSDGDGEVVSWGDLPGKLHAALANALPEDALGVELAAFAPAHATPPRVARAPPPLVAEGFDAHAREVDPVGIFLLQSPGHHMWKVQAASLRRAWSAGWLGFASLHVMVHHLWDWRPEAWRDALREASTLLRGLHWCGGYNRYPEYNPRLMQMRGRMMDNYWNKVFTMTRIARLRGYRFLVSLDDDVMLAPSTLAALAASGPALERGGCGVVAPLTQNGIPSVELWADAWLGPEAKRRLFSCFSGSSGRFCGQHCCRESDSAEPGRRQAAGPFQVPSPWDVAVWYRQVAEATAVGQRQLHPVRGNLTCMTLALELALELLPGAWLDWGRHGILADWNRSFPHLCNNAFLMRTDRYAEVVGHPEIDARTDEVTMNRVLHEGDGPMCFLSHSFGVHPAWGTFGSDKKTELEDWALSSIIGHLPAGAE